MRLLHLDHAGVKKLIDDMEKDTIAIKQNAIRMAWHMRGGASYEDILNMSIDERNAINKIIEDNLETTKKSNLPFF